MSERWYMFQYCFGHANGRCGRLYPAAMKKGVPFCLAMRMSSMVCGAGPGHCYGC